ncbi:MAG TPA: MerR family transcriptional regulator [Candidatus Elarobacter sp.]|jgi:DNA-binding transcriptional MerR regulator|nr:MerR family transcriptional regulator [Candidatus Elarobacter sp.]
MPSIAAPERASLLSVAEAAARLDVSPRTLRYYEELGFLTPVRTAGGHRLYGAADLETIARIGRMQALGFSLATIRKALRYRSYQDESGRHTVATDDLRTLAAEARADAAAVRARIAALRRELDDATREADQLDHDVAYLERRLAERIAESGPR